MTIRLRFGSIGLVWLGSLAICAVVWAQPGPSGPPPGPGGPGFRGPGFGMFGGGAPFSISMQYGRLLMMPTVQKELELVDDQKAKLKEAGEKAQAAMRELFSGMRDLSEEDRRAKMAEVGKKMTAQGEQMKKAIEEILLPHQLERLRGIAIQIVGVPALNDKEVQQSLKLTEEQTAKMKSINEEAGKKMRELFGEGRPDFRTIGPKMQEIGKETQKQLLDVLTDEQKTSFEKMKGEKLEIPASELRGPGGPGGPGGPRPPAKTSE